jgi:hypothetical protein
LLAHERYHQRGGRDETDARREQARVAHALREAWRPLRRNKSPPPRP